MPVEWIVEARGENSVETHFESWFTCKCSRAVSEVVCWRWLCPWVQVGLLLSWGLPAWRKKWEGLPRVVGHVCKHRSLPLTPWGSQVAVRSGKHQSGPKRRLWGFFSSMQNLGQIFQQVSEADKLKPHKQGSSYKDMGRKLCRKLPTSALPSQVTLSFWYLKVKFLILFK